MATYKLMQDIEAEDHILGPLSLRQFIFALVAVFAFYLCFLAVVHHVQFLLVLFLPPALFCTFFAFPFGRDQPTEVWALAKLRFLFKPRRRIWDQSGVKELVTITVPKKIERVFTDGLNQNEVKSRLNALANTLDSRGWVVKNVNVNTYSLADSFTGADSDRLIAISAMPQAVPDNDVYAADDILDAQSNPVAHQFDQMINQTSQNHRQELINAMNQPASRPAVATSSQPAADYWFMQGSPSGSPIAPVGTSLPVTDSSTAEEAQLSAQLRAQSYNYSQQNPNGQLHSISPLGAPPATLPPSGSAPQAVLQSAAPTPVSGAVAPDPAILSLANNNDLNVATIAREAERAKHSGQLPGEEGKEGEVVISLH